MSKEYTYEIYKHIIKNVAYGCSCGGCGLF